MTSEERAPLERSVQRLIRLSIGLYALVALLGIALGVVAAKSYHDSHTTQIALCALRGDLEKRVTTSTQFLIDHPNGVAGIPAKTIQDGIDNQRRTIHALRDLNCK